MNDSYSLGHFLCFVIAAHENDKKLQQAEGLVDLFLS